ncbi:MAG: thioredoxin-dependent thiol peroxidase [Pseudomonadota bacterium]
MSSQSPEIGAPAPKFELPGDGERNVALSDYAGRKVIVYFYPKDDTPGCTKEAVGFSESIGAFEKAGATVIGISKDPVKKHDKFVAKHDLKVTLASDENSDVCERYGVWVEKSMYGKTYMGIERATFLIDGEGKLQQIWRKVRVPGHVDAVLEAVQAL